MPTERRILSLLLIAALVATAVAVALPAAARVTRAAPASQADSCAELVTNGGFEVDFGWQFDPSITPPQYVTTIQRAGSRSLQLGVVGPSSGSSSSAARQVVTVPPTATSAILSFWYYPIAEASPGADRFEFGVMSADGSTVLAGPWQMPIGLEVWQPAFFDFSAWRGQTFQLYFNVFNDGTGGRTVVFLDDVAFAACAFPFGTPTPSPTWTPWPTPWPTPIPTTWPPFPTATPPLGGCFDLLQNGSFDAGLAGWAEGNNSLRPAAVSSPALTPPFAAQMGATVENLNSFSSIRQTVTVPAGQRIFIGFWVNTWAESLSGADRQQFVLLGPGNVVWATPWKVLENGGVWQQHLYELIGAPSSTFDVYFAAVNDGVGGRTALTVDEVHVWACAGGAMPMMTALGVGSAADMMGATDFSAGPVAAEVIPYTPEPSLIAEPTLAAESVFAPEASVTPIIVPFEAAPAPAEGRTITEATALPQGTPVDVTGLPTPGWTEVAISGQPTATPVLAAQIAASATPLPPEGRAVATLVATSAVNPQALLTRTTGVIEAVAPSPTRLPFGLLSGISERTAQWPIPWYWVLLIIVVVVIALIWLIRRTSRGNYYTP